MTTGQLALDFSALHHLENTVDNQLHFEEHKEHFSDQCRIVYEALIRGERLTVKSAMNDYGIGDLRRRIKDLKDQWGVDITAELIQLPDGTKTRHKEYYLKLI